MKKISYFFIILLLVSCGQGRDTEVQIPIALAKKLPQAHITNQGIFDCFEENLRASTSLLHCETSAVVFNGQNLIFGSDAPIPGKNRSAAFSIGYTEGMLAAKTLTYLTPAPIVSAIKYEDFTLTPDGQYIIATTGFDRVKRNSPKWDNYNMLLAWPANNPNGAHIISPSENQGVVSSVNLRKKISSILTTDRFPHGVPYFKIEGLAAIPGNKLLFGVREHGRTYNNFSYVIKIIAVSYQVNDNKIQLADDFSLAYSYNPNRIPFIHHQLALSSIEYDKYNHRLYLLTSFEEGDSDEGVGGFMWILPLEYFRTTHLPLLVLKQNTNKPLMFAHKAEGITVLAKNKVFVIHDDDRVLGRDIVENPESQFSRKAHQAAYDIVELFDIKDNLPISMTGENSNF